MRTLTYPEIIAEIERVKTLLVVNRKQFTVKQNKVYLARLEKQRVEFERRNDLC